MLGRQSGAKWCELSATMRTGALWQHWQAIRYSMLCTNVCRLDSCEVTTRPVTDRQDIPANFWTCVISSVLSSMLPCSRNLDEVCCLRTVCDRWFSCCCMISYVTAKDRTRLFCCSVSTDFCPSPVTPVKFKSTMDYSCRLGVGFKTKRSNRL